MDSQGKLPEVRETGILIIALVPLQKPGIAR